MEVFKQVPAPINSAGKKRLTGFELEFANLDIERATAIIQQLYGGDIQFHNRYFAKVTDTAIGAFTVKLDISILYGKKYNKAISLLHEIGQHASPDRQWEQRIERMIEKLFRSVVPYEIVTPPVPIDELDIIEKLRKALYEQKAKGTEDSTFYAFATHINAEVPSLTIETIMAYLKAFLLLYPYLLEKHKTNLARKVTPFINPFPRRYVNHVLKSETPPAIGHFIDHYHAFNPTRNRPLDLYPVLAVLNEEKIKNFKNIGNVKQRPTFHYRLPNSSIQDADWSLAQEWNSWCIVEKLAYEPALIKKMTGEYLSVLHNNWYQPDKKWKEQTEKWVHEKLL